MAKINKTPWELGSIFVCSKCGAKFNEPELADEVKSHIRKKQKADETQGLIRVIVSGCLGVCFPEKQTFAFMPVNGPTEVFTSDLKKDQVIRDITELIEDKMKSRP